MILITLGWLTLDTDYRILATGIVLCVYVFDGYYSSDDLTVTLVTTDQYIRL